MLERKQFRIGIVVGLHLPLSVCWQKTFSEYTKILLITITGLDRASGRQKFLTGENVIILLRPCCIPVCFVVALDFGSPPRQLFKILQFWIRFFVQTVLIINTWSAFVACCLSQNVITKSQLCSKSVFANAILLRSHFVEIFPNFLKKCMANKKLGNK